MFRPVLSTGLFKASLRNIRCLSVVSNVSKVPGFSGLKSFSKPLVQSPSAQISTPVMNQILEMPSISELTEENTTQDNDNTMYLDSVLRKRRLKMKKHKLRKRRRNQRALKKRLGKL